MHFHVSSHIIAAADSGIGDGLLGDKSHSVVFDNSKIKALVPGFEATIRFDIGVRESVANFLLHAELRVEDPEFDRLTDSIIRAVKSAKKSLISTT